MAMSSQVLTDCPCPALTCKGVPLLRSPEGQQPSVRYCANCDGPPNSEYVVCYHVSRDITRTIKPNGTEERSLNHPQLFPLHHMVHGHQPRLQISPAL